MSETTNDFDRGDYYRDLYDHAPDGIYSIDSNGIIVDCNETWARMLGYSRTEIIGRYSRDFLSSASHKKLRSLIPSFLRDGEIHGIEYKFVRRDGSIMDGSFSSTWFDNPEGISYSRVIVRDDSERQRAREALRQSEQKFRLLAENIAEVFWLLDPKDYRVLYVSPAYEELWGRTCESLYEDANSWLAGVRPADLERVSAALEEQAETGEFDEEFQVIRPDGSIRWVWDRAFAVKDEFGQVQQVVGVAADITEHKRAEEALRVLNDSLEDRVAERTRELTVANEELEREITERKRFEAQLEHAANHDSLTNLLSRRRFDEEVERELSRAQRTGTNGALLFIDFDDFKDVNDSLGHRAGDELLVRASSLLQRNLRDTDTIGRLGGDEFGVLLPNTDLKQASVMAEELLQSLRAQLFDVAGQRIDTRASIGIATFSGASVTAEELLSRADLAMYRAKEQGRDRFFAYTPASDLQAEIASRLDWRNRIHQALEQDRFVLLAQPILDLTHDSISQCELLLRMIGPDGEKLPPSAFLKVAERSGSLQDIERWVVRHAIRAIAEYRRYGREPCVEVNLSGRAIADSELLPIIRHEVSESGIDASNLIFEITETAAIEHITQAQAFITSLKALGCRFALDDFGIGISSFYLLKHLSVDFLKIDGSFIRDLPRSPVDQHLVRAMVGVARGLGIQTIAEHVGDEETLRLMREYGVDYAQGFYIGRPGTLSDVL